LRDVHYYSCSSCPESKLHNKVFYHTHLCRYDRLSSLLFLLEEQLEIHGSLTVLVMKEQEMEQKLQEMDNMDTEHKIGQNILGIGQEMDKKHEDTNQVELELVNTMYEDPGKISKFDDGIQVMNSKNELLELDVDNIIVSTSEDDSMDEYFIPDVTQECLDDIDSITENIFQHIGSNSGRLGWKRNTFI